MVDQTVGTPPVHYSFDRATLLTADIQSGLPSVPSGIVDAIVTDPPYGWAYRDLVEHLACTAARVLKPGGACAVMYGHAHLPDAFASLTDQLTYVWTLVCLMPYAQTPYRGCAVAKWKPVILCSRNTFQSDDLFDDVFISPGADKSHHPWGQPEDAMRYLIEHLTKPDELVLDPFVGGGATAAAAVKLGRRFVGSDIDPVAIETSARRLTMPS